jgi:uncharacterized membrane protein (DUF485 family)
MAGLDHPPVQPAGPESEQTVARNARYGLALFAAYLVLYGGFMVLNAFRPAVMDVIVVAGVNLAIVYGLALIVAALLLALVYGWICRTPAPLTPTPVPRGERGRAEEREGRA